MESWELTARECVRDTLARYTWSGDAGRIEDLAACFCDDGELEIRSVAIEPGRLDGSVVSFPGLEGMVTEVFVRVSRLDGSNYSALVRSTDPRFELSGERGWQQRSIEFIVMGFEHILKGADHLLFVFGLLLIVGGARQLIKTVTAFTLAHSITLALAALGVVNLPPAPIEALIALSILLLGPEVIHRMKGETSLAIRMPWLVAFVFGLLHGFGFAGGLSLIGVPGTAGFVSKWVLVQAALEMGWWPVAMLIVASSLLAVIYVWKMVETLYMAPVPEGAGKGEPPMMMLVPIWIMAAACIWFGLNTDLTLAASMTAAKGFIAGSAGMMVH